MANSPLTEALLASQNPSLIGLVPRTNLAQSLLEQGASTTPANWAQALARLAQTAAGSHIMDEATSAIGRNATGQSGTLAAALTGAPAPQRPAAPSGGIGSFLHGLFSSDPNNLPPQSGGQTAPTPAPTGAQPTAAPTLQPTASAGQPPSIGSMATIAGSPSAQTALAQAKATAMTLLASPYPALRQAGAQQLQNLQQKAAEAEITAGEKRAEGGVGTDLNTGFSSEIPNYGATMAGIKGAEAQATANANKSAEAQYAGPIMAAQERAKLPFAGPLAQATADAAAPSTIQTPGGPTLMTVPQQRALAGGAPAASPQPTAPGGPSPGAPVQANAGGAPLQDPKVREAQIAEITGSSKRFADAQSRLQNLGQIQTILSNPNIVTGMGGDELQSLRGGVLQAYTQLGITPPTSLTQGVANAEALKAAANNLAIEVSKDEGVGTPRVSIFNAISQNKPGLTTSPQGNMVRLLAMQQAAKRESDFGNFAPSYYQQPGNFNKQDAEQAFSKAHPVSDYTSQIYPQSAADLAKIPVGQMLVGPDGLIHTKQSQGAQP